VNTASIGFGLNVKPRYRPHPAPPGEAHFAAKLSDAAVRDIRASAETQFVLAARYNVHQSQISRVRARKSWAAT
jgi:hypothetical protein